ncbi:MAG: GTPase HflX [Polyangiaceae bacterium]|nr:GTPase HflX [Polyangiaceae bacterium]
MSLDSSERPNAVLVSLQLAGVTDEQHDADVAELGRLVHTLGLKVVGTVSQRRAHPRAGTVLGLGKLVELAAWTDGPGTVQAHAPRKNKVRLRQEKEADLDDDLDHEDDEAFEANEHDDADVGEDAPSFAAPTARATVVVVDHELSPREQRNLEQATGAEVIDRSQVIVEIFHRHAKSREARLQVEIARLTYVAPRLREAGAGADRQRGGIGGKGAGESAVELDRRRIRDRIAELKREISQIQNEQATRRSARRDQRRVALVGYTNAGKSSMMRALTGSEVYVADKLFATLDTTVRSLKPETEPRILVSDTVGFIKKLPHQLVASFRSTLDEALEASLLLYLVDASDPTFESQLETTRHVLSEIGANEVPSKIVLNKRDRLDEESIASLRRRYPDALILSAKDRADVAFLREHIISFFDGELVEDEVFVPYERHALVRKIHDAAVVLGERYDDTGTHVKVRAPKGALERIHTLVS